MLSAFFHPYGWGYSKETGLARQNCRCWRWQKSDEKYFCYENSSRHIQFFVHKSLDLFSNERTAYSQHNKLVKFEPGINKMIMLT